jgi:molecular chaperone GrpE
MADDRVPTPGESARGEGDGVPETGAAEGTLAALREARDALAREAAEAQERHLRALADFDNYRKRVAREREDWSRQAQEQLLREILPVLDNFDRALQAPARPGSDPGFRQGVELIHRDFLAALERLGVRPFAAVGQAFDPGRHEAVGRVERADVDDQTVVAETLRGYVFQERVLRPAQVVVAVHPAPAAAGGEGAA